MIIATYTDGFDTITLRQDDALYTVTKNLRGVSTNNFEIALEWFNSMNKNEM